MPLEDPLALLARLKLGREEFCQRLLTMLILDGPYPLWNTRSDPSPAGAAFLQDLYVRSFGEPAHTGEPVFVDELDLPRRHDGEKGSAPDYAVIWPDRLWMIELKTERASHRAAQLPGYLDLGSHHYPNRPIDLTYLTPPMMVHPLATQPHMRFAHLSWPDIDDLLDRTWGASDSASHRRMLSTLHDALSSIGTPWQSWRTSQLGVPVAADVADAAPQIEIIEPQDDPISLALQLAQATALDGEQRALDLLLPSLEELQAVRLEVRRHILAADDDAAIRRVQPWLWNEQTSGGKARTVAGAETGYELRLSRSASKS